MPLIAWLAAILMPIPETLARSATALASLLALAAAVLLLVWIFQRHLIYLPMERRLPSAASILVDARELRILASDAVELGAWLVPARRAPSRGGALVFNGNAGHRAYRARLAATLAANGLDVLLFDYRGYGDSDGRPSETGLERDARAARQALLEHSAARADRLVYFGESLGAAVAIALALEAPPAALILRSPFTSLADVGRLHYPFLPVRSLLRDRYPSLERAGRLRCPTLVVAGAADRLIPAAMSRRLYDALPEPRRFVLVQGADHNDLELLDGLELRRAMAAFLDVALPWPGQASQLPGNDL